MLNLSTISGLFNPKAFITATRQYMVQANSWSLEELHLDVCVTNEVDKPRFDNFRFDVKVLKQAGAECKNNQLTIYSEMSTSLTRLRWIISSEIFLNRPRQNLLITVDLYINDGQKIHHCQFRSSNYTFDVIQKFENFSVASV
jgi:dynein heavy chain 1